ncbi:hypothetical protein THRCLA_00730 [Thraustotheca clavata]|uniref:Uncharacterized protein n=1 Tax=Thraustotheca clavata TaxID=74557 RepID=A0A1W0AAE8_9STRA|nr:hypothetical protein THRCLA_00730 [Thraustotheca clavata]
MYWGLGNDLNALSNNMTSISGKSLIRSSSNFAFANMTLQQIFLENGTILSSPLSDSAMVIIHSIGPFGSVDLKYISVPGRLNFAMEKLTEALCTIRAESDHFAGVFSTLPLPPLIAPTPQQWIDTNFLTLGGTFLCPPMQGTYFCSISHGLLQLLEYGRECVFNQILTHLTTQPEHLLFGMFMASINNDTNISPICKQAVGQEKACISAIKAGLPLVYALQDQLSNFSVVKDAYTAVLEMNIQLIQIGALNETSPIKLYQTNAFDSKYTDFDLFGWVLIYDWILGYREIISFEGDVTQMTLLGDSNTIAFQTIDQRELPVVFSLYALRAIEYVTLVMILIAILTALYLALCRCHVAAGSTLELSRIGGIVWLGRPLLFARGITALSLLATATLQLEIHGPLTSFSAGALPWYTTCLAANEVTWLGGIVTDIGLIFTTDYAIHYSTWNSVLIWTITACLTILLPVQHQATFSPNCEIVTIDFQVRCHSGTIAIGSLERFGVLVVIVVASNIFCYYLTRYLWPNVSPRRGDSILLSAGAKYLLDNDDWVVGGIYYMDRSTAVLDGLLSFHYHDTMYVFDVKSWKMHALKNGIDSALDKRLQLAIPLPP